MTGDIHFTRDDSGIAPELAEIQLRLKRNPAKAVCVGVDGRLVSRGCQPSLKKGNSDDNDKNDFDIR